MDTAIVQQFLDFFQDFINLCQFENWPDNNTTESEIKNAFLISQHIEKCLDRLQKQNLINEFLSTLNSTQDASTVFLKKCFADPPKYVLKKIINSKCKISQMDVGFKVFLELFDENKLEVCLTEFMLETASKETLLMNLSKEIPKEELLRFKSLLFLSQLNACANPKEQMIEMLNSENQETLELLVVSLLNKDITNIASIKNIEASFINVMLSRTHGCKNFWKLLFNVKEEYLLQLCSDYNYLFKLLSETLLDSGKLLREHMSAEFFYIDLTYSELKRIVQIICKNDSLKVDFFNIANNSNTDLEFWENILL